MSVTISIGKTKSPEVEAEVVETVATQFDPEVDELAGLLAWKAKQKKDAKEVRLGELIKKFAAQAAEIDDEQPEVVFEGEKNRYKFGKPSSVRTITSEGKIKFAEKVGEEAFLECATIALKDIDQYIAKGEQGEYLEYSTGSRSAKLEAKIVEKK